MNGQSRPHYSLPSLIAIGAAIASLFTGSILGFMLALVAIFFGFIGVMLSFSPEVRGGFVSIISLVLAALGILVAVIRGVMHIL